jgi:RNA polymerase sigma factor (sigma-70 family)
MNRRLFQSGEHSSFAAKAARLYGVDLYCFLRDRLKSEPDARDVAQEVYLRLLRLGQGELVRDPRAYVYFVARQVLAQFRLRERGSPVVYDSVEVETRDAAPQVTSTDGAATGLMALGEIEHLLSVLPALQRDVFVLRTFEGLGWAEIAERLQISVHTVKHYVCRANAKISMLRREA